MNLLKSLFVFIVLITGIFWAVDKFYFNNDKDTDENIETVNIKEDEPLPEETKKEDGQKNDGKKQEKEYVTVYFLGVGAEDSAVFKKVKRELPKNTSKINFAITQLLKGVNHKEKQLGVYSEIPKGTKLLHLTETNNKVIIDINSDFQYGGGADSLYNKVKQIIKTALANAEGKEVYLYLDGKQADVIGGEGLMLKQPLSENSIDD